MNLIVLVSLHVFLALIATIFFYWINLSLLSRKGVSKRKLVWRSAVGSVSSILVWVSEAVYLRDYYVGKEGFNTDPNVTELLPAFALTQGILLPLVAVISVILFILIVYRGEYVGENKKLKGILIVLSMLGWISASALMFLGVLLP